MSEGALSEWGDPDFDDDPVDQPSPGGVADEFGHGAAICAALEDFEISAQLTATIAGEGVTRYELRVEPGVKMRDVAELEADVSYAIGVGGVRILAPIPGRAAVGVDVTTGAEEPEPPKAVAPYYASGDEFLREYLLVIYRRSTGGHDRVWCPQWWRHAEAVSRIEALWRSWEHLRLDGTTGLSIWMRDHLDHHMPILLSADGPFKRCADGHKEIDRLSVDDAPNGLLS